MAAVIQKKIQDFQHLSQSRSNRFLLDQLLREHRFSIVSRPKQGEPIWQRNGKLYKQSEALQMLPVRAVENATHKKKISVKS